MAIPKLRKLGNRYVYYKKIDGEVFYLHESSISSKIEAQRHAERLRKQGNKARVMSHGSWWAVWYRKK